MRGAYAATGAFALLLAACNDGNRPSTVSAIAAQQIQTSTSETSQPLELNQRRISDRDTSETAQPRPL